MDKSFTPESRLRRLYKTNPEFKKLADTFATARKECDCEYAISDAFKLSYDLAKEIV